MKVNEVFGIPEQQWQLLVAEFENYKAHQSELVAKYNGKYLVLHEKLVAGAFDSNHEASKFGGKNFEPGSYLIQRCSPGPGDYTVRLPFRFSV